MGVDRLLSSRFEMKYIIREDQALRVREFVRAYMQLDEYGVGRPNFAYPVHSLYLDSQDLKTYWATINGEKNRYKLRMRFYNDDPDAAVFCEVKRRQNNCIIKHRGAIWRRFLPEVLAGQMPPPSGFVSNSEKHQAALMEFIELMNLINATPRAHVAYFREAYLPPEDNHARVTMDRAVRIEPQISDRLSTEMRHPRLIWGDPVILELKFTDRYPLWFREMVEAYGLVQCSAAKYVAGIELVGEDRFNHSASPAIGRLGATLPVGL